MDIHKHDAHHIKVTSLILPMNKRILNMDVLIV